MIQFQSFLDRALTGHAGKKPEIHVAQLAGDASARRYYRVTSDDRSLVLMSWEPFHADDYPFLSVHRHFKAAQVQVPEVVAISESEGLILLEDLGDLTLERKFWENQNSAAVVPFYEKAIDELIKINFATARVDVSSTASRTQFDTEKFLWEFNYSKEHFLEKLGELKLSPELADSLKAIFVAISQRLHELPKWITHRDYHSRNLMIKTERMRVIDFQDARGGPLQYDLVSLLRDSYVTLGDDFVSSLLKTYLSRAEPYLPKDFSTEHFYLMFELQSVQRCFKACGSFASFWNTRQDTRYLKYISPTLKRVLKALLVFPEYSAFANLLIDSGLLERKFE